MMRAPRTVALVAAHFPPSNLAGVHRARLLSQHLHEFGWRPIIVTTHWRHYEEALDRELESLIDPSLEIIRTPAFPTRPIRIVGDLGVRALPWHLAALKRLRREKRVDFVHITIPSCYSAVLGELLYRENPLPFGIDYIDPWVHVWPEAQATFSRAWASMKLGAMLEPWAVRNASLITGVASGYFAGVLDRHPHLRDDCVTAAMPYGFSTRDFEAPSLMQQPLSQFDPHDRRLHLVYAGAMLPKGRAVLERLLEGVAWLRARDPIWGERLRLHFIGCGKSPNDPQGFNVIPVASRLGVGDMVTEHPHRMSYIGVLAHLKAAHGVMIIGSTEPHYTPSKVYQAVQARRPALALLHEASTAVEVLERSGAGRAITFNESALPNPARVAEAIEDFLALEYDPNNVDWSAFDAFSARESARILAAGLDEAVERAWEKGVRC